VEPSELERRAGEVLRQLPGPRAPGSLLPRVMVAARARAARPWYSRAWMTWPLGWRVASAAATVALVAAVGMSMTAAEGVVATVVSPWLSAASEWVTARTVGVRAVVETTGVLWRALVQPVSGVGVVVLAVMWMACATLSVVLSRVALGEAVES
jgi:hypothetical protein